MTYDKNKTSADPYFYNITYNKIHEKLWQIDFSGDISDDYDFICASDVKLVDTKLHTRQLCVAEWIYESDDWSLLFNDLDQFDDSFRYVEN